jgi:4'-phosphopantetheinyl transferase
MDAYWLEQTEADVPAEDQWLSAEEMSCLAHLRFGKRRADWRLGRWTAKRAVASCLNLPSDVHSLEDIEIRPAPSGSPEVFLFNQSAAVSVSLSHRAGKALCVVGLSGLSLGCDLELVESRDHSFVTDFFTVNEQKLVESAPADKLPMLVTLLWSAKESALKALHVGLRLDTTSIEVGLTDSVWKLAEYSRQDGCADWSPMSLRYAGEHTLRGCWRCADNLVRTVVVSPLQ